MWPVTKLYYIHIQQRKNPNVFPKEGEKVMVRVKVSGDGAAFSRSSNLILLSYSLLDLKDEVLAGKGLQMKDIACTILCSACTCV